MKKSKIEYISIAVSDPIKMTNWYRKVLGFEIIFSPFLSNVYFIA